MTLAKSSSALEEKPDESDESKDSGRLSQDETIMVSLPETETKDEKVDVETETTSDNHNGLAFNNNHNNNNNKMMKKRRIQSEGGESGGDLPASSVTEDGEGGEGGADELDGRMSLSECVYDAAEEDQEESCLLGIDCNEVSTVGLVLRIYADTKIHLDGDG